MPSLVLGSASAAPAPERRKIGMGIGIGCLLVLNGRVTRLDVESAAEAVVNAVALDAAERGVEGARFLHVMHPEPGPVDNAHETHSRLDWVGYRSCLKANG